MNTYYVKTNYYNGKRNEFFVLDKETPCKLRLLKVVPKQTDGDCFEGHEIPTDEKAVEMLTDGKIGYVYIQVNKKNTSFVKWDGKPVSFDHL